MKVVVEAIKSLQENDITWEAVSERLIEEHRTLSKFEFGSSVNLVKQKCQICGKDNYSNVQCFLNLLNLGNNLSLKNEKRLNFQTQN